MSTLFHIKFIHWNEKNIQNLLKFRKTWWGNLTARKKKVYQKLKYKDLHSLLIASSTDCHDNDTAKLYPETLLNLII